jgi:RNA polymerase sigma-70 factor (ECF subfamily)
MARDTKKFLELLKPHYNDALKYSRALCANWSASDAKDVLQDSLLKGMENLEGLRDESKFRSWFFKIITREFYSSIRKHFWKRFLPLENYMDVPEMPDVFDRIEQNETKLLINKALSRLSAKERAAILLFEIAEFSIEEIKELQGERSLSAVKSRLSRTREKLRKYIEDSESKKNKKILVQQNIAEGDLTNETIKLIAKSEQSLR